MAISHPDETRRVRALWALHVTGGLDEPLAIRALQNEHPHVRAWTVQLLNEKPKTELPAAVLAQMLALAKDDPSPVVRLYLTSALQRMPLDESWRMLAALLRHSEDADDHNLPLMYWYAAEPLAVVDASRALKLAADGQIPLVFAYMVRRVAKIGTPDALATLVTRLKQTTDANIQGTILASINEGLKGRRQVPMPAGWSDISTGLMASSDPRVAASSSALALTFGDPAALRALRTTLADDRARRSTAEGLDALVAIKDPQLAAPLQRLLGSLELRGQARCALALYDDAGTPPAILAAYDRLNPNEKRDALATLAARLVRHRAVGRGRRQASSGSRPVGRSRAPTPQSEERRRSTRELPNCGAWRAIRSTEKRSSSPSSRSSRARPARRPIRCWAARCSSKPASNVTRCSASAARSAPSSPARTVPTSNTSCRTSRIPSAVMAKEYQPSVIATSDGRVITALVKKEDADALTVQTANELLVVPRGEIDAIKPSQQSMMPDDLLKPLSPLEVRRALGLSGFARANAHPGHTRKPEELFQRSGLDRLERQHGAVERGKWRDRRPHHTPQGKRIPRQRHGVWRFPTPRAGAARRQPRQ